MPADSPSPNQPPTTPATDDAHSRGDATSTGELIKRLGPTGPLAIAALALPPISGASLIYFMKSVATWLQSHQTTGLLIYAAAFAVLSGLALLPTYAQAALGGYAFGWLGLPAALFGFAGGALIGYGIARRASGDRVERLVDEHPKWRAIRDALVRDKERGSFWQTTWMVALLRMPPNSPFALTNLVMASVKVPWTSFILGTIIGMLPRTAVAVYLGKTIGLAADGSFEVPLRIKLVSIPLAVLVLVIVMDIADRAVKKFTHPENPPTIAQTLPRKLLAGAIFAAVAIGVLLYLNRERASTAPTQTPPPAATP